MHLKSESGQKGEIATLIHKEKQERATAKGAFYFKERTLKAKDGRSAAAETAADAFSFQSESKFDCTTKTSHKQHKDR